MNQYKKQLKSNRIQEEQVVSNQQLALNEEIVNNFTNIEQSITNQQGNINDLENLYNNNNNQMENINKINDKRSKKMFRIRLETNKVEIVNQAVFVEGGLSAQWFLNEQNRSRAAKADDEEEFEENIGTKKRPGRSDITKIKDIKSMKKSIKTSLNAINKNGIKICKLQKQIQKFTMPINILDAPANIEPTEDIINMMKEADELLKQYDAKLRDIRNAKRRQQPDEVDNHYRVIQPIFQCCFYDGDAHIHHLIGNTAGSIPTRLVFEAENGKNIDLIGFSHRNHLYPPITEESDDEERKDAEEEISDDAEEDDDDDDDSVEAAMVDDEEHVDDEKEDEDDAAAMGSNNGRMVTCSGQPITINDLPSDDDDDDDDEFNASTAQSFDVDYLSQSQSHSQSQSQSQSQRTRTSNQVTKRKRRN